MPLGCLGALFGFKEKPASPPAKAPRPSASKSAIPTTLPLATKRYFFSRDEQAFFRNLEEALGNGPYRAFPNVRLNDVFTIQAPEADQRAVYARLRDKHVDFLIVDARDAHRPVLALELDGASHQQARQQHSDAVKDMAFASAGLKLRRLPSRAYAVAELRALLRAELPG